MMAIIVAPATAQSTNPRDLTNASLQELMDVQITSVSRRQTNARKSGAAIFVITQEDIRRSGGTNIPDLLRMVPGVNVARITANSWAISIRGFNHRYSTKVLVLIDGRTVYSPVFSGVNWDQQGVPLENIDRIEVIRGPGGTLWGANAMNGVINIITKRAKDTPGGLVAGGGGMQDRVQGLVQYGGGAGKKGAYRIYTRHFRVANSASPTGRVANDSWHGSQVGFRSDWNLSPSDSLTVQGDFLGTSENQTITTLFSSRLPARNTLTDRIRAGTGNLLGRWSHTFANGSQATVQMYYDRTRRLDQDGLEVLHTGDFDSQYHFEAATGHNVVAGLGYRRADLSHHGGYAISFGDGHRKSTLLSAFGQDEIRLGENTTLTVGSKVERNNYTGFEYEPSAQFVWTATPKQTVWASAARAIQQPSWYYAESETDATTFLMPGGSFGLLQILGNPASKAAVIFDYEAGYRHELTNHLTIDATGFLSDYRRLQTLEPLPTYFVRSPGPPHLVMPQTWENFGRSLNLGVELTANARLTRRWRLSGALSALKPRYSLEPGSRANPESLLIENSPRRQVQFRSTVDLPRGLEWDTSAYFVGSLGNGPVPSYVRLDTRLGWLVGERFEFSLAGQNLLAPRRFEFLDALAVHPTEASRSVFAKFTYRF